MARSAKSKDQPTQRLSAFGDKERSPTPGDIEEKLGKSARLWRQLIAEVSVRHAPIEEFWNFGGPKYGWALRLKKKDRVVVYLIPQSGQFLAGIVLGEKAFKSAQQKDLPAAVVKIIESAPRYAEGHGIRMPVKNQAFLKSVLKLIASKMEG
jgi:Protein of unknown function (DUF3788)